MGTASLAQKRARASADDQRTGEVNSTRKEVEREARKQQIAAALSDAAQRAGVRATDSCGRLNRFFGTTAVPREQIPGYLRSKERNGVQYHSTELDEDVFVPLN